MHLSPCPFCGDSRINTLEIDIQKWSVVCDACQASGPMMVTKATAIQAWESVAGEKYINLQS